MKFHDTDRRLSDGGSSSRRNGLSSVRRARVGEIEDFDSLSLGREEGSYSRHRELSARSETKFDEVRLRSHHFREELIIHGSRGEVESAESTGSESR